MTEFEAKIRFKPYFDWLRACWQKGWEDYHCFLLHPMDDARSRAAMIQNRAIIHGQTTCVKYSEIVPVVFNSRRLFRFGTWAILQMKKVTDDFHLINNMNDTADAFDRQEFLAGIEDIPRITSAYCPNTDHTGYTLHLLHTKSHYQNNWVFGISADQQLIQLDFPNEQQSTETAPRRVQPRGTRAADAAADESAASS